ncbi:MAG: uracil-DNA glycosylase [Candidatus Wallbacteria bacterium]|nr:uracil-DNA glycosylase [Candidatus Wallbacteria bacterium]
MDYRELEQLDLNGVASRIKNCFECSLAAGRSNAVPGEGNGKSRLLFIGEGPGEEEDLSGRPFVGKAGELLDKILQSVGFERKDIYLTNVVKCRPPNNRDPSKSELNSCWPYLLRQIESINPLVIAALGRIAAGFLLSSESFSITRDHGKVFTFSHDAVLMPLYHPSYLLRNPSRDKDSPKYQMWEDVKRLKQIYDSFDKNS